jgi:DNA-binding MurR/RpiR family transcriptional regulator
MSIMDGTNISHDILDRLAGELSDLTPEARKAATYVLENPQDVGVSTVREIAEAAKVKPNTVVRMARQVGFEGYDDFREPFRDDIRKGIASFPDRARWLQSLSASGDMGPLFADLVGSALRNIEDTFANISVEALKAAAEDIWASRQVFTLGVGVNNANARKIPSAGSNAIDDLAWADERDILIAITCKPYRREVVDAVKLAREQGITVVGISDSPASPIIAGSKHGFVVACDTPQFFPSSVSTVALLETLLSFVIASATPEIVQRVETFHERRHQLGIYEGN